MSKNTTPSGIPNPVSHSQEARAPFTWRTRLETAHPYAALALLCAAAVMLCLASASPDSFRRAIYAVRARVEPGELSLGGTGDSRDARDAGWLLLSMWGWCFAPNG